METREMVIEQSEAAGNVSWEVNNLAEDPDKDPIYTLDGECGPLRTLLFC